MGTINMNSIPDKKPAMNNIIPKGSYIAKIVKAEMRQGKDESKPPYFSAECDITDPASNTGMGKFWIMLFESEAPLCRFQLGRFIKALHLNIQGEFELKDLTKMVVGKSLVIDICPDDEANPQRSQVDISADCFYPLNDTPVETPDSVAEEINEVFTAPISEPTAVPQRASSY